MTNTFTLDGSNMQLVLRTSDLDSCYSEWPTDQQSGIACWLVRKAASWKLPSTCVYVCSVAQACPTLCSPPGSSVHGILQARTLQWVAISYSRGSSRLRDQT